MQNKCSVKDIYFVDLINELVHVLPVVWFLDLEKKFFLPNKSLVSISTRTPKDLTHNHTVVAQ